MLQVTEMTHVVTGRMDRASVAVGAARMTADYGSIAYKQPVDLAEYNTFFSGLRA